ncbi:MAG: heavy-metal-associated domain-containing protein [Chloroflexota bacterium]
MPQMTLYAPAIHCEHCIETIHRTVDAVPGARFLNGSWEARSFNVDVDNGGVLDAVATALAAAEYPLGDAAEAAAAVAAAADAPTHPDYRVTRTEVGADVNYACPCSCDAGFALDRSKAEQAPESCCCGRLILVGPEASSKLRAELGDAARYHEVDVQTVTMPWGQPMEVALATPRGGAEHGSGDTPSLISFLPGGGH